MSDKTPFRPYINPEMAEYENSQAIKDLFHLLQTPISNEEYSEIDKRITTYVDIETFEKNPSGIIKNGNIEATYKSNTYTLQQVEEMDEDTFERLFDEDDAYIDGFRMYQDLEVIDESTKFTALDELIIKFGDIEIDIYSLLPKDFKIVLTNSGITQDIIVNWHHRYIWTDASPASLGGLLLLLHEVGHVVNEYDEYQKNLVSEEDEENEIQEDENQDIEGDDSEEFIYEEFSLKEPMNFKKHIINERNASLFALRKLWKELRKNPDMKKDSINYLRRSLYTYYTSYLDESAHNNNDDS